MTSNRTEQRGNVNTVTLWFNGKQIFNGVNIVGSKNHRLNFKVYKVADVKRKTNLTSSYIIYVNNYWLAVPQWACPQKAWEDVVQASQSSGGIWVVSHLHQSWFFPPSAPDSEWLTAQLLSHVKKYIPHLIHLKNNVPHYAIYIGNKHVFWHELVFN